MTAKKGICSTCRYYVTAGSCCKMGIVDRPRGKAAQLEPCGWWKARRRARGDV